MRDPVDHYMNTLVPMVVEQTSRGERAYDRYFGDPTHKPSPTLGTLAEAPFNKIRFCVFPKYYDFNRREPLTHPFERGGGAGFCFTASAASAPSVSRVTRSASVESYSTPRLSANR